MVKEHDGMKEEIKKKQLIEDFKTMLLYCLKCIKNTESKNPKAVII